METKDYLKILKDEIHSTVFATVDENGLPVTRVIDIMLADEQSLYFITAKGKAFYSQLMRENYVAITGMTGSDGSMNKKAISVRGKTKNLGTELLDKVFEENTYMSQIYPTKESRIALEVFQLYEGQGEYFDLSTKPITRACFQLGGACTKINPYGKYSITSNCIGCKLCYDKCPQKCIEIKIKPPFLIQQDHCLHCGNCYEICPANAVLKY